MRTRGLVLTLLAVSSGAVLDGAGTMSAPAAAVAEVVAAPATTPVELVETTPVETVLDNPRIPEAFEVWPAMIGSAESTLDFAQFYASNEPGSRLETVIEAVEAAADRGVRVRFLAEEKFARTYPETLERLAAHAGIEVRRYDVAAIMGGVLHAKYFIVDGREAYLGSQNFDWRSLTHIQELGARILEPSIARAMADVFEMDWALSAGADPTLAPRRRKASDTFPVRLAAVASDTVEVLPVFSPRGFLPDESLWDLPRLVELLDGAKRTIRVQLLTYRSVDRDGSYFEELESALRRAAARGVEVRLLLSDWCKRSGTIETLQSLEALPGIEIRLVTIPAWSGGFIPYARVIHAKYLVVDAARAWMGTSNWEKSYFLDSRNVGLVIDGGNVPRSLDDYFAKGWNGPYAEPVDPCGAYEPPRIGE